MDSDRACRRNHNVDTDSDIIHGPSSVQDSGFHLFRDLHALVNSMWNLSLKQIMFIIVMVDFL